MSWSLVQQSEDLHDQLTILLGSALRLLGAERGVFVVSNEAFDPQSSSEYVLYQVSEEKLVPFLDMAQEGVQPTSQRPLVSVVFPALSTRHLLMSRYNSASGEIVREGQERCSLYVYDPAGPLGLLHGIRMAGRRSCFEHSNSTIDASGSLRLFIA